MPTYEYRCSKCRHEFEVVQKMVDDPLTDCPECGGKVKRLIGSGAGIIFKGDGFYVTDYRSEKYKKDAAADKKRGTSDTKSTDSKKKSKTVTSSAGKGNS